MGLLDRLKRQEFKLLVSLRAHDLRQYRPAQRVVANLDGEGLIAYQQKGLHRRETRPGIGNTFVTYFPDCLEGDLVADNKGITFTPHGAAERFGAQPMHVPWHAISTWALLESEQEKTRIGTIQLTTTHGLLALSPELEAGQRLSKFLRRTHEDIPEVQPAATHDTGPTTRELLSWGNARDIPQSTNITYTNSANETRSFDSVDDLPADIRAAAEQKIQDYKDGK